MTIIQGTILTNQTREAQDIAVDEQGRVYVVIAGNLAGGGGEEAMWGGITGNIADQIDLGLVLEEKADHAGTETITGAWTFNPAAPGAPFTIGANGANQLVVTLNADLLDGEHGAYYLDLGNSTGTIDTTQISDFTTEVNNLITAGGTGVVTGNTIYQGDITYEGNVSFTNVTNQPTFAAGLVSEGQITINTDTVEPPIILGVNQQGQVVVGLNADQIDGLDSTYLLDLSNSTGTITSTQISDFTTAVDARITAAGTGVLIGDSPSWTGSHTWQLPLNLSPNTPTAPFVLNGNAQGQLVSGLNADLLDGEHGTYYLDLANSTGQIDTTQISDFTTEVNNLITISGVQPDDNVTWTGTHQFENTPITITSTAAQPPFLIQGNAANRLVVDLNSDRLDNQEGAYYLDLANSTGNFNRQIQFASTTQQPPFTLGVNQQEQLVDGLNADQLDGYELSDIQAWVVSGQSVSYTPTWEQTTKPATPATGSSGYWHYVDGSGNLLTRFFKPTNVDMWVAIDHPVVENVYLWDGSFLNQEKWVLCFVDIPIGIIDPGVPTYGLVFNSARVQSWCFDNNNDQSGTCNLELRSKPFNTETALTTEPLLTYTYVDNQVVRFNPLPSTIGASSPKTPPGECTYIFKDIGTNNTNVNETIFRLSINAFPYFAT